MASISVCSSNSTIHSSINLNPWQHSSIPLSKSLTTLDSSLISSKIHQNKKTKLRQRSNSDRRRSRTVFAVTEGSAKKSEKSEEEAVPKWARPDSEEPPPWAKNEAQQQQSSSSIEIPFYVYLLSSAITAIAAVGSVFEYLNKNPVFGLVDSDSVFYTPLLGFLAFTGIPTSAFLWFKSVETANKEAEEQDRRDGYR